MSSVLERLRAALAPEYDVEREIASGGMGMVFLGRDTALECPVAIKVLRPELATAHAAERFLREARMLASLRHPHIVPVHHVGQAGEFFYYVMDFLEGETLADRLARGPLGPSEALKLGRDLLDALQEAHERLVVHRDIKPSNVFFVGGRALLVDFGIAKPVSGTSGGAVTPRGRAPAPAPSLTAPGSVVGTLDYMPPEQAAGAEVTPRADLYAVGMVLYEALTGRQWSILDRPDRADWSGVSRRIARVLRRALQWAPEARWRDAASFRRALWRTRVWPYRRNTIGVALGCTVLGIAVGLLRTEPSTAFQIRVDAASSPRGLPPWLGDSIACTLARSLDGYPELAARCASGLTALWTRGSRVRTVVANVDGRARIRLASALPGLDTIDVVGPPAQWRLLVDTVADRLFGSLLLTRGLLDPSLPPAVLPKTRAGLVSFAQAERLFAQARWGEARSAYAAAVALDSTCWLCYWRHGEVGRWVDLHDDPADSAHYLAHAAAFPGYYQSLIRAQQLPVAARIDSLDALVRRRKDLLFGQFRRADELLHRGPLVGRPRREAVAAFEDVLKLRPAFGPALQHLAWVRIAEGDSAGAADALARAEPPSQPTDPSFATLALLELASAWRFARPTEAAQRSEALVRAARAAGIVELDAGARYLPGFGAPEGALWFADRLASEAAFARSAGIVRTLALVALGRPDSALVVARALADRFPELRIFVLELSAATLAFDADSARFGELWPPAHAALASEAERRVGPADRPRRAAWMLAVVEQARRAGPPKAAGLRAREPVAPASAALLQAGALAARGAYGTALATTDGLIGLAAPETDDPFFRAVLHLSRAGWYERVGQLGNAQAELMWHENSDLFGYPTGDPQPAEVDWAFGPLAEWRRGALLDQAGGRREDACRAYGTVARLWRTGEPRYRARADSAARRLTALGCGVAA